MSVLEAKRTTLADLEVLMKAQSYRIVDEKYRSAIHSWDNMRLKQTRKKGNKTLPLYTNFKDFFDYEKELEKIDGYDRENIGKTDERMEILKRIRELNKGGEE